MLSPQLHSHLASPGASVILTGPSVFGAAGGRVRSLLWHGQSLPSPEQTNFVDILGAWQGGGGLRGVGARRSEVKVKLRSSLREASSVSLIRK